MGTYFDILGEPCSHAYFLFFAFFILLSFIFSRLTAEPEQFLIYDLKSNPEIKTT